MKIKTTYEDNREDLFQEEGRGYPGKALVEMELKPSYIDAQEYRIKPMLELNQAQLIMLTEQGIISDADARLIAKALMSVDYDSYKDKEYTGEFEDLFFEIEDDLIKRTEGLAGNIHIARSRNDMSLCMDHMVIRSKLYSLIKCFIRMENTVRLFAQEHKETLYVAHTHTQHAQPSVLGHYFLGVFQMLDRDFCRFRNAYYKVNSSPMGAAAITTSGFNINRPRVAELLGFSSVIENSFDAIGNIDFNTETASSIMLAAVDLGRVVTDLITWATEEMNMIRVNDGYISTSSIMPQKRNPIALEHLRSSLSIVKGLCSAVIDGYLKSPYGDISDHEDIEPILVQAIDLFIKNCNLFNAVIGTMDVNKSLLKERAFESFSVVTEMADTIVRECSIPFRKAHHVVSTLVKKAQAEGYNLKNIDENFFDKIFTEVIGKPYSGDFEPIKKSMDPVNFVKIRGVLGGVSLPAMNSQLEHAEGIITAQLCWLEEIEKEQICAEEKRNRQINELIL